MPRFRTISIVAVALMGALNGAPALGDTPPVPVTSPPPVGTLELSAPGRAMALADAIAYARAHQPAVLASLARVAAAKEAATVPRAQWQPVIGASAQVFGSTVNNTSAMFTSVPSMEIPRIGATRSVSTGTWQPYASTYVGAGVHQELFEFGRIAAQAAAADALADVQRQAASTSVLDVTYGVEEAYFAVHAAKGVLVASQDAYDRSKVHRDLAKAGVTSGLRSPIELTRAESDLARFDAGRIRAAGGVAQAETFYAAAVGVPDAALDVAGAPATPADLPALSDAIASASARDPRIKQAMAQLRADEEQTRAIGALQRPDIFATGSISGRAGGADPSSGPAASGDGWIPNVANWDVGAVLSWPLFEPTVIARKRASRAEEEVRRSELAQVRFEDFAAVRRAFVGVQVARAALPTLQQAVDASHANYAQADARFKAGLGNSVELADAEALRADAEIQLALGVFDLARARAIFGRTIAEGL